MADFNIIEGSPQDIAMKSTKPIQLLAGGYGWGKTSLLCVKVLKLMQEYPNMRAAILRNTRPNLENTIKKEFLKWCPKKWIAKMPTDRNNTLVLHNGSEVLFSYIKLTSRGDSETMNLLSATFDLIVIDQLEDPEFSYKLFQDLQGRLRGTATYVGNEDMPKHCNYFMATTNPTLNWINTKLVRPLKMWQATGTVTPELLKDESLYKKTGKVEPIIDLIEGTTYDNKENLPEGFIERLENIYTGVMREKYMLGKWDTAENLVYPMFNYALNVVSEEAMLDRLNECRQRYTFAWRESLDFGIAVPSCYLLSFIDEYGIVNVIDGWYCKELQIRQQAEKIKDIRMKYGVRDSERVISDPALFRRSAVDTTVENEFRKLGITLTRGNNNILGGISKVGKMLSVNFGVHNPYTGQEDSPMVIFSSKLKFLIDEIVDYRWKKDIYGNIDKPSDKNDHAMDSLKYLLTYDDNKAKLIKQQIQFQQEIRRWTEV